MQATDLSFSLSFEMAGECKNRIAKCSIIENSEKVALILPESLLLVGGRIYEFTTGLLLRN